MQTVARHGRDAPAAALCRAPRPCRARARAAPAQRAEAAAAPVTPTLTHYPKAFSARAQVTPAQRTQAKAIAYGLLYGKGRAALAADLGCAPEQAARLMESFRSSLPGLARARMPASLSEGGPYCFVCMAVLWPSGVMRGHITLISLVQAMVAADLLGCDEQVSDWAGVLGCRLGRPLPLLPLTRRQAMRLRVRRVGLRAAPQDAWLTAAVRECKARPTRCIQTLGGRRRYLPDIAHADAARRARAERQAVNSICQARRAPVRRLRGENILGYGHRTGRAPHRPADMQVDGALAGMRAGRSVAWPSFTAKRPAQCPLRYMPWTNRVALVSLSAWSTVAFGRRPRSRAHGRARRDLLQTW